MPLVAREMLLPQGARADQCPDPLVGRSAQRLDQIARERLAPERRPMVEAKERIKPCHMRCAHRVEMQQRVGKREAGIDRIARRAPIPPGKAKGRGKDGSEAVEVGSRRASLDAPHARDGRAAGRQARGSGGKACPRIDERLARIRPLRERGREHPRLPPDLGEHEVARPRCTERRIHDLARLRQPHCRIVVRGTEHDGHAAARARAQEQRRHAGFGETQQDARIEARLASLYDDALEEEQRHGAAAGAAFIERERVPVNAHFELRTIEHESRHCPYPT